VNGLQNICSHFVQFQVASYNPATSFGEHQFFIYINAQDAQIVHVPIVPTRLGDILVTVHASTLLGKDTVTRKLHVEVTFLSSASCKDGLYLCNLLRCQ
jgi:hypothetical protein